MKKIAFVLPRPTKKIVGGFKVVYGYAQFLSKQGFDITIIYDCHEIGTRFSLSYGMIKRIWGRYLYHKALWAHLSDEIKVRFIASPKDICDNYELIIATAINTVQTVINIELGNNENKAYFIQGFENWGNSDSFVYDSYKLPLKKIVVSKWLHNIVSRYDTSNNIYYCSNGINTDIFFTENDICLRNPHSILFMYHEDEVKGLKTLLPVLVKLKREFPDLIIKSFGAFEWKNELELDGYTLFANEIQLHKLYNEASIFVCPSYAEGFGLTGAEAMACGCALVTSDTNGSREYANEENANICKIQDEEDLYFKIKDLLINNEKRVQIAERGSKDIMRISLLESEKKFMDIVNRIIE